VQSAINTSVLMADCINHTIFMRLFPFLMIFMV